MELTTIDKAGFDARKALPSTSDQVDYCRAVESGLSDSKYVIEYFCTADSPKPVAMLKIYLENWSSAREGPYLKSVTERLRSAFTRACSAEVVAAPPPQLGPAHANCLDVVKHYFAPPKTHFESDGRVFFAVLDLYVGEYMPEISWRFSDMLEGEAMDAFDSVWDTGVFSVTELLTGPTANGSGAKE